jgi:hypothetical protein
MSPIPVAARWLWRKWPPDPPLRLVLGGDAIDSIRNRLESLATELSQWEAVGRDTALSS